MSRTPPEGSDRVLRSRAAKAIPSLDSNRQNCGGNLTPSPCHRVRPRRLSEEDSGEFSEEDDIDTETLRKMVWHGEIERKGVMRHVEDMNQEAFKKHRHDVKTLNFYRNCLIGLILCVFGFYFIYSWPKAKKVDEGFEGFKKRVYGERRAFKQNDGTFERLAEGVAPPTCVTLLYLEGKEEAECISSRIKNHYETAFSTSSIVLRGSDIYEDERFDFLNSYGRKLNESKLMILYDLHQINAQVAENFHSLCDVENPFVSDSLIIFTLNMDTKFQNQKNPLKKAYKTLNEKWKDMEISSLDPLITRITTVVVEINKENDFACPK